MDTRDSQSNNKLGANNELGRHQRVLDAYLAHAGSDAMPPAALDAKLIALAASSIKAASKAPPQHTLFTHSADAINAAASKTNTRSRRRRWPFALAASVATLGFAAILARTTFQDAGYDKAVYPTPSYEAKSVAADQAPAADAQVPTETPAPMQEEKQDDSRAQAASVAAMSPEDKAKLSRAPDPELARAMAQARGQVAAAPPPASPVAAKPIVAASASAPAEAAAPEVAELDAQAPRNRRNNVDAAPIVDISTENGVAEIAAAPAASAKAYEPSALATNAPPPPQALSESQADSAELAQPPAPTRSEAAQSGASAPQDDMANAKKDEFAPDAQTDPDHAHAKTYAAIRALRDSGELAQAKAMLARFRKVYPLEILPDDLKALGKTK